PENPCAGNSPSQQLDPATSNMTSLPDDQVLQLRAIKSERCAASDRNTCARSSESAVVDAIEQIGDVGLGIEAVHLGAFDECHGAGQRLSAGLGAGEQPDGMTITDWQAR